MNFEMRLIIIQFFYSLLCASFLLPKYKNADEVATKREFYQKIEKAAKNYIFEKVY